MKDAPEGQKKKKKKKAGDAEEEEEGETFYDAMKVPAGCQLWRCWGARRGCSFAWHAS